MKLILFNVLFSLCLISISNLGHGQVYTTESKSCSSCNKQVSNNSQVGMKCPHCGVRWGSENETKSFSTSYQNENINSNLPNSTNSYYVKTNKSYFHNEASKNTRRKGYLIYGEVIYPLNDNNGFIYVEFTNKSGIITKGWLLKSTLNKY